MIRPSHVTTAEAKATFLKSFAKHGIVKMGCIEAGVSRATVQLWRKADAKFAIAYREAEEDACDALEALALSRARAGLSDTLLIFLLKSRNPARFNDRLQVNVDHEFRQLDREGLKRYIAQRLELKDAPPIEGELVAEKR